MCRRQGGQGGLPPVDRGGAQVLRRRPHLRREVHRGPPPHRDPAGGRHARQCRHLPRARVLHPAPQPEGGGSHGGKFKQRTCARLNQNEQLSSMAVCGCMSNLAGLVSLWVCLVDERCWRSLRVCCCCPRRAWPSSDRPPCSPKPSSTGRGALLKASVEMRNRR